MTGTNIGVPELVPAAESAAIDLSMAWLAERLWLADNAPGLEPRRRYIAPSSFSDDDVLATIPPAAYIETLTGEEMPERGMALCPLPDHDDHEPSFAAYDDPERGWYCFGCNRGGDIYSFAAALWNLPTRGSAFVELRTRLATELLRRAA